MVSNLSSDGFTIKTLVSGNLRTHKPNIMTSRSQKTCCIGRYTDKSELYPAVRKQAGVEKYGGGTNSSPEHPSGHNLAPLDSLSPEKKSILKRTKSAREESEQIIIAFYQALNNSQNNDTKLAYEI